MSKASSGDERGARSETAADGVRPARVETSGTPDRQGSSRTGLAVSLGLAVTLVAALAAFALGVARPRSVAAPMASASGSMNASEVGGGFPDFGSTMSKSAEATDAYRAAMHAYRDADDVGAARSLDRAISLDGDFAAARLRRALVEIPLAPEAREHARAAMRLRAQLGDHDRVLVEVVTALADDPARFDAALAVLERASQAAADADFTLQACRLQLRRADQEKARATCARAAALDPEGAMPVQKLAMAKMYAGDTLGGIESFDQCLRLSPVAVACLTPLWHIYANEGRCRDALDVARRLASIEESSPDYEDFLAQSLFAVGESRESVRLALASKEKPLAPADAATTRLLDAAVLSMATGEFDEADARLREMDEAVKGSRLEADHYPVSVLRIQLAEESGRRADAIGLARAYLQRRPAWDLATEYDFSIYFLGELHALGGISDSEYATRRASWLEHMSPSSSYERVWMDAFVIPASTAADARAALEAAHGPAPEKSRPVEAAPEWEEPLGRVDLLAGRPAEALTHLASAADACTVLNEPVGQTRASLERGLALEELGRKDEACAAYDVVVRRWGGAPRSVSARRARERRRALRCP